MQKTKRCFSWILVFVMLLSMFPTVLADTGESQSGIVESVNNPSENSITSGSNAVTAYYVASFAAGGRDSGDGTRESPFIRITQAVSAAQNNNLGSVEIRLLSNIESTESYYFDDKSLEITIISDGDTQYSIAYTGTRDIGNISGFVEVNGATVNFRNVILKNGTEGYDGRVLYVGNGGVANLEQATVMNGRMVNSENSTDGGGGIYAASGGRVNIGSDTVIKNNSTQSCGGGIYIAKGGFVSICGNNIQISGNEAARGGGLYIVDQGDAEGGLEIKGIASETENGIVFSNNKVTATTGDRGFGGAAYIEKGAKASVAGKVSAVGHKANGNINNIFLAQYATLDISDATLYAALGISCEDEYVYRLVSLPVDGYSIKTVPADEADEAFWEDDCGAWNIRYMVYKGVPGLYLYYHTLDASFKNVDTLTSVMGTDINDESRDFLNNPVDNSTNAGGLLTVPGIVPKGADKDFVITFTCDTDNYRIPTEDVVSVKCNGADVPFDYVPDFANGTATVTVSKDEINKLTGTLEFTISAERLYDLTLAMEGPLYAMTSSITGHSESSLVLSESSKTGTTASYKLTLDGAPAAGITVELYEEGSNAVSGTAVTGADGVASFSGLKAASSYYPVLKYEKTYKVINRDVINVNLSTLVGQTLKDDYTVSGGGSIKVATDIAQKTATISNVSSGNRVTFYVNQKNDTITFLPNDEAASTNAVLSVSGVSNEGPVTKEMQAGANTYGILATASLTGYTHQGWYTEAEGGTRVEENTEYISGSSPTKLYAHWTANNDTAYKIQHWVEYSEGGANCRYDSSKTKVVNGVTYYLYEESSYRDGTSDAPKDISSLDLKTMSDSEYTWWTRNGFTAVFESGCVVKADGSSVFNIYYDRNAYEISFVNPGAGTATSDEEIPSQMADFGALIGTLPVPHLPGYEFGGWYDGGTLVTATDIYTKTGPTTLTAKWNAKNDTKWAIAIMTQDIAQYPDGMYYLPGTYTNLKFVYRDNSGNLLVGTSDTTIEGILFNSIDELKIEGYNYVGYSAEANKYGEGIIKDTEKFSVTVKPTDATTDGGDEYNKSFDGGIVYLYYNRKIKDVEFIDGQGNVTKDSVIFGGDFTGHLPPDPGRDGYDFTGWVDPNGDPVTEETPASKYTNEDGTLTIRPTWKARNYRLTYVPGSGATFVATNGGAGEKSDTVPGGYMDSKFVTYDQPMGTMPTANKPGHDFIGWFLENDVQITEETNVDVTTVVIHNDDYSYEDTRPLYAQYTPHVYTLRFYPGESSVTHEKGTVSPETMKVTYGQILSGLPTPTLRGYRFTGWSLTLNDPSTKISNGDVWNRAYANGTEIPVYANWVAETYRYTFDLNDTKGSTRATLVDTSVSYVDETFDSVYKGVFEVEAIRNGYNFMGWSLIRDGEPLDADDIVSISGNVTLYAVWEPKTYPIRLVMKGGQITDLTDNRNLSTYDPTARYDAATDTWTFDVKFDSVPKNNLPVAVKTSCTFHGYKAIAPHWDEINGKSVTELPSYTDWEDEDGITLIAMWEPWITFDPDGSRFTDDGSTEEREVPQSEIDELPEVEKDDYTFIGWVDEDDPDHILTLEDVLAIDEPTVLKPIFSANITFDAVDGKVQGESKVVIAVADLKPALPSASKSGFTFDGWFTGKTDGDKVSYDSLKAVSVPTTVYAHYTAATPPAPPPPSTHIVTFDANGGSPVEPQEVTHGGYATEPFSVKRGYEVEGWYTDDGVKFDFANTKVVEDITLTAKWVYVGVSSYLKPIPHIAYITGYPDGTVGPEKNITRAEVAMIFYRLLRDDVRENYETDENAFIDVASDAWYGTAVSTLANMGILQGYGDTFEPDKNISRAEFAAVCARFDTVSIDETRRFSDVSETHWAYEEISSASAKGWIDGYPDGTFRPENAITRAETMTLINRVLARDKLMLESFLPDMIKWPDNADTNVWYYLAVQEATNSHDFRTENDIEYWTKLRDDVPAGNTPA